MKEKAKNLPEDAKLAYKGEIFEVYQWEQKMYDGATRVFERIVRPDTVEVLAIVGDKIIIEEQLQPDIINPRINLPSGRADEGDNMLDEAKRELLEETGYESEDWHPHISIEREGKIIWNTHIFIARNCRKTSEQKLDGGEKIIVKLISFDELIALSDEPRFWVHPEFISHLLRLRLDPVKKEEFRKLLFP